MNESTPSLPSGLRRAKITLLALSVAFFLCLSGIAHAGKGKSDSFFADAKGRFDKGDFAGALIQARNALQEDREHIAARILMGRAQLNTADFTSAETALIGALAAGAERAELVVALAQAYAGQGKQKLVLTSPDMNPAGLPTSVRQPLLLIQGAAHADLGDIPAALRTIAEARALDPQTPGSYLAEVPIRLRQSQYKEAAEIVEKGAALAPDSAEAHYMRGSVQHAAGKGAEAVASYGKAIQKEPTHLGALIARAGLLIDLGKTADASADLAVVKTTAPRHPLGIYLRALLAERDNKVKESQDALRELTTQLDQIPLDYIRYKPQVLMLNGLAHYGLNEPEKAKQYFEIYLKAQGDAPIAKPLAQIYLRSRNYEQAITVLEIYLRARPDDAQALALLGSALMAKGQYARAANLMEQAVKTREDPTLQTVLGLSLLGGGQSANAIKQLEKAVKIDPGQIQAATTLIAYYQRTRQFAKAIQVADALSKKKGNNPGLLNMVGGLKLSAGDQAGARASFESARKLDPKFTLPTLNLARLDLQANLLDAAEGRLKELLTIEPKNPDVMFEMATLADRRGRPAVALDWLEKAAAHAGPRDVRPGLALAEFHLASGNPRTALKVLKTTGTKAPDDFLIQLLTAKAQMASGDAVGAKISLANATRVAEFNPDFQTRVAELQLAINNLAGADYSLTKALSTQSSYLPAQILRAEVDIRQGNLVAAEKSARELVTRLPKSAVGQLLLAQIAAKKGQAAEALAALRRAHAVEPSTNTFLRLFNALAQSKGIGATDFAAQWLKTHPNDVLAHSRLGMHFARLNDLPAAKQAFAAALTIAPNRPELLNSLANVLIRLKDPEATKVAEKAVQNNPGNGLVLDTLGWAQFHQGLVEQGLATLRKARDLEPDHPEIHYHLGVVLAQTGQKAQAVDELRTALKLATEFPGADKAAELLASLK